MVVQVAKVIPYNRDDGEKDIDLKYPWRPVDDLRISEEKLEISERRGQRRKLKMPNSESNFAACDRATDLIRLCEQAG